MTTKPSPRQSAAIGLLKILEAWEKGMWPAAHVVLCDLFDKERKHALQEAEYLIRKAANDKDKDGCGCYTNPDCTCDWISDYLEEAADEIGALRLKTDTP